MEPFTIVLIVGALLGAGLLAYALSQRSRPGGPPPRRSRTAVERYWDTPEHSDAWEEERPPEQRS